MPDINGQVILLILFVVISAVKWLIEKIKTSDETWEGEEPPGAAEDLYEQYRDEIRNRQTKLKQKRQAEARAQAQTQVPPPLPSAPPPRQAPEWTPEPTPRPAAQTAPPARQQTPSYQRRKTVVTAEQQAAASRFAQRSRSTRQPSAQQYVRKLLSNPQSTRQAIILAEILGKPKSLQSG